MTERRRVRTSSATAAACSLVAIVLASSVAYATPTIGAHDVPTLFYVAKSDDRNRVDYGVRLDASCAPIGDAPLYAYWRRFEPGQPQLGDLNFLDRRGYEIAHQQVRVREANGSWIEFGIRALPSRRLLALVQRAGDRCVGAVQTTIRSEEAVLDHVFVQLDGPMRIREVVLRGEARVTGHPISERLRP
ncbi:MAG: DUF4833 domain-containing protein [Myxococcota bacterium]|nr:DUF4833 domain-containing protein [Myxococcota bacterium]